MGYITNPPLPFGNSIVSGITGSIADGATITHGLGRTPTWAIANGTNALQNVQVTAKAATTITVSIKTATTGAAGANDTISYICG
jgi:hypothetical protein